MRKKKMEVYAPQLFKKTAQDLIDLLVDHLEKSHQASIKVQNWKTPKDQLMFWKNYSFDKENPAQFFKDVLYNSVNVHHPQYMGHQISPPAPIAALASLLGSLLNNGMAVYEMGAAGTAIEKLVIEDLNKKLGFEVENADGFLTSGGTLANLTALLTARQVMVKEDVWKNGLQQKIGIMVSSEAHYCVERAAKIMGLGSDGVIEVPVDELYRMRVDKLQALYEQTRRNGIEPIAIVASAPSTSTGMHDDIKAIGKFAQANEMWFHVDGAHGGAAIFSDKYKHYLNGIEQADSVVIDGHKMLMTPALLTFLLYKDKSHARSTFSQKAQYLLNATEDDKWYDIASRSFECTKRLMSIQFYILLQMYGIELFNQFVTTLYDLGLSFAKLIQDNPYFELAVWPETNIVCFRYFDKALSENEIDSLNMKIRQQLLEEGSYYIVQTNLKNRIFLRTTIMNPMTQSKHFDSLLLKISDIAKRIVLK